VIATEPRFSRNGAPSAARYVACPLPNALRRVPCRESGTPPARTVAYAFCAGWAGKLRAGTAHCLRRRHRAPGLPAVPRGPDRCFNDTRGHSAPTGRPGDAFCPPGRAHRRNHCPAFIHGRPETHRQPRADGHRWVMRSGRFFFHNTDVRVLGTSWQDILPTAACRSQYRPANRRR
jgi:hypothetical protein